MFQDPDKFNSQTKNKQCTTCGECLSTSWDLFCSPWYVVDDVGMKYVGKEHRDCLIDILNKYVLRDWGRLHWEIAYMTMYPKSWLSTNMKSHVDPKFAHMYEQAPRRDDREFNGVTEEPESSRVGEDKKKYV